MRGIVIGVSAALALALPGGAAANPYCQGANRDTIAETSGVRVYKVTRGERELQVIACLKRNGRKTFLWFHGDDGLERYFVEPIRIKGPLVAFGSGTLGRPNNQGTGVEVIDLRTRRPLFAHGERDGTTIRDLELTRAGSVAWIADDGEGRYPVRKHDAGGTDDLDHGAGVDPASLTRTESELHWLKSGEPRSAAFR